jgi:hypothetical protein
MHVLTLVSFMCRKLSASYCCWAACKPVPDNLGLVLQHALYWCHSLSQLCRIISFEMSAYSSMLFTGGIHSNTVVLIVSYLVEHPVHLSFRNVVSL